MVPSTGVRVSTHGKKGKDVVRSHRIRFRTLPAFACLCGLYFTLAAATASGVSYDVYLLAGQSNMDGRGLTNDLTGGFAVWNQPQTNVLIYYQNNADQLHRELAGTEARLE